MATIHVDASLLIYHQELRILSLVSWFLIFLNDYRYKSFFENYLAVLCKTIVCLHSKNAHLSGEHFFDLIASGLLVFEMVVSSYHPCRILMMRKLQLRLVC